LPWWSHLLSIFLKLPWFWFLWLNNRHCASHTFLSIHILIGTWADKTVVHRVIVNMGITVMYIVSWFWFHWRLYSWIIWQFYFYFLKNLHTEFHSVWIVLHYHQQCMRVIFPLHPCHHSVCFLFIFTSLCLFFLHDSIWLGRDGVTM
jgi:hypothetical protein